MVKIVLNKINNVMKLYKSQNYKNFTFYIISIRVYIKKIRSMCVFSI